MIKRIFDFTFSIAGLIILSPLLAIIAFLARVTSTGPSFFRQKRVGLHGRDFCLYKFRTMTVAIGAENGRFDAGGLARVTCFGALLRKLKLDELPQLWNVAKGDMSLVGPRPEVRKWVDVYPERWAKVLTVRPGITDPASITYRNEEELLAKAPDPELAYKENILPHKLSLYEAYISTRSFWGDIALIFKTLWRIVFPS